MRRFYYNSVVRLRHTDGSRARWEKLKHFVGKMVAPKLSATSVLTATADFHHLGFFGFLAIFTTVLAALFGRAITCWVRTFAGIIVCHRSDLLKVWVGSRDLYSVGGGLVVMLGAVARVVKCSDTRILRVVHGRGAQATFTSASLTANA